MVDFTIIEAPSNLGLKPDSVEHLAGALLDAGNISLTVNGEVRQSGDLAQMIWDSAEIISQLSRHYRLEPGDLIYTGTPAGVGAIKVGDVVRGEVADLTPLTVTVVEHGSTV